VKLRTSAAARNLRSKEFTRSKPGDAGMTSVPWFALWSVRPGMDGPELSALFTEAEKDPAPEFRIEADPATPRHTVDAVRTLFEVERALRTQGIKRVEFAFESGRPIRVETERIVEEGKSVEEILGEDAHQTLTVKRHAGRNVRVSARVSRLLK
jgi:hypothetical protein